MPLKLSIDGDDVDQLAAIHAPGLVPHLVAPSMGNPAGPMSAATPLAPPEQPPAPPKGQGLKVGRPTITAEEGSPGFYKEQMQQMNWDKQNPWGSPENHPGFLGKVGHVLGRIGNIAGDVLAPATTALIPGSDLNNNLQMHNAQRGFAQATQRQIEQENADTSKENVEQKPDLLEASGELKGRLEAQKESDAERRQQTALDSQESRAADARKESESRQAAQFAESEKRQSAQFAEGEKMEGRREAAAENRLQQTLKQREDAAGRKDVVTHDKQYVQPAEQVERSYQLYKEAQKAFESGDTKTGAATMLLLSQHLNTTFGQVKGSRLNKDLILEHKDAIGVEDRIERFISSLSTGQQLSSNQVKEFGDQISNMRKLTWQIASKEADRKKIPIDFLPPDLGGISHVPGQEGGTTNSLPGFKDWQANKKH